MSNKVNIFISYRWNATKEDVWQFADQLKSLSNFEIWLDKQQMYANKLERMEEGIKSADVVLIFFNDDYQTSLDCRTEAEAAYRHGKRKLFVKMQETPCRPFENWFAPIIGNHIFVDFYNFKNPTEEILKHLEKLLDETVQTAKKVHRFGDIPSVSQYTERPQQEAELRKAVEKLCQARDPSSIVVLGEGGIGKTTLITKSCLDDEIYLQNCQVELVLWLNVYQVSMDYEAKKVYNLVADRLNLRHGPEDALAKVQEHLKTYCRFLLVLDDLFHEKILQSAFKFGSNVRVVAITRNRNIFGLSCDRYIASFVEIDHLSRCNIIAMFQNIASLLGPDRLAKVADLCSGLPLLASVLRSKLRRCSTKRQAESLLSKLFACSGSLLAEKWEDEDKKRDSISELLLSGFENETPEVRKRYYAFLVFDEGTAVSLSDLAILWNCQDLDEAAELAAEFRNMSLLRSNSPTESEDETYTVHAYLYAAALDFALKKDCLASNLQELCQILLLRVANVDGENVLHQTAKGRRALLIHLAVKLMKSNPSFMFEVCEDGRALDFLINDNWPKNAGTPWETCQSLSIACELIDRMLLADRSRAVKLLNSNGNLLLNLLVKRTKLNVRTKWFRNPLMVASTMDNRALASLLLECEDIDVNMIDDLGNTPLLQACMSRRWICVRFLLEKSAANVNAANDQGETALIIATKLGDMVTCEVLLNCPKINVNHTDNQGNPAAMYATRSGFNKILQMLIQKGADVTIRNKLNESALCQAIFYGNVEAARMLKQGGGTLEQGEREILLKISKFKKQDSVETILKSEFDDGSGSSETKSDCFLSMFRSIGICSPSEIASLNPDLHDFFHAIHHGEDVGPSLRSIADKISPRELWMGFALAAFGGVIDTLKTLLLYRPKLDVNEQSSRGKWTALMYASQNGHSTTVKLLLEVGVDATSASYPSRWTALHIACRHGHLDTVKMLLEHDDESLLELLTEKQEHPLFMASENGHWEVVEELLKCEKGIKTMNQSQCEGMVPLAIAALNGHEHVVRVLLQNGAIVDVKQKEEATPLMYACWNGNLAICQMLIEAGADVNEVQKDDSTPLFFAAHAGHNEIVKLLLAQKADINWRNKDDLTVLMVASYHGKLDIVKTLLSAKACVTTRNKNEETAEVLAQKGGNEDIAKLLASQT